MRPASVANSMMMAMMRMFRMCMMMCARFSGSLCFTAV